MSQKLVFQSLKSLAILACVLMLSSCADDPKYVEKPVDQLYNQAKRSLDDEKYATAATQFEEVDRQHPYSNWATKAKIMAAYSRYMALKYDDAIAVLDAFIQVHPGHQNLDYVLYLKGLCYYEQIADVERDQLNTEEALASFEELIRRFPESKYSRDANLKISLTKDHLAGKEMKVGRYYMKRKIYHAAIPRFRNVIQDYQTTSHVPEALHRLTEAFLMLGLKEEARQTAAVLGHNYPGNEWYIDAYALIKEADGEQLSSAEVRELRKAQKEEEDSMLEDIKNMFSRDKKQELPF